MSPQSKWSMLVLSALALSGCADTGAPPPISEGSAVHGRVTLDGKPLEDVGITFVNARTMEGATMMTKADGLYEFVSYKDGQIVRGLPTGEYLVAIAPARIVSDAELHDRMARPFAAPGTPAPPPPKPLRTDVPAKYGDYNTSGLSAIVGIDDNRPYDFDLKKDKQ